LTHKLNITQDAKIHNLSEMAKYF